MFAGILRSVQGIKDVLREREGAFNRHPVVCIATGNAIHSFQLMDLGLCWFKSVGVVLSFRMAFR